MALRTGRTAAVALVLLAFTAAACASSRWQTDAAAAPGADLASYTTFGWQPSAEGEDGPLSIAEANLRRAVRAQLVGRGYRETDVDPDLRIGFETDTQLQERTSPAPRVGVGVGTWGGSVGTTVGTSVPVGKERVTTAAFSRVTIRFVDPRSNQEVWVGTGAGEAEPGLAASAVDELVSQLMEDLPASRR